MRIVVAMSGGVDSSVVAGLMARAGHEVIGLTLQLYDHGAAAGRKGACCAGQDIYDAKRVADHLGFAHYVVDAQKRFETSVIAAFADSYAAGQTPVPCIACNQHLKFGDLLAMARDLGAEAMATGHYARIIDGPNGAELHKALDKNRDQSWFLSATTREQLAFCRFPLGDFSTKAEVRAVAAGLGLEIAAKPDSQDICFVPQGSYTKIVGAYRPDALEEGEITAEDGMVLGKHQGIANYTVGQAKKLGPAGMRDGSQQIVKRIDAQTRRIIVGPRETESRHVRLRDMNWLVDVAPEGLRATAKMRARDSLHPALISPSGGFADMVLDEPALAPPGQAAVLYNGSQVLGGGFIV